MDKNNMAGDIKNIMSDRPYNMEESNRKGKYISLNLKLTVDSQQERDLIFAALKSSANVTMVL